MQTTLYPSYREYIRLGLVRSKTQRRVEGTHVQHTCVGDVTPPRRVGGLLPSDASPAVCVCGGGGGYAAHARGHHCTQRLHRVLGLNTTTGRRSHGRGGGTGG